MVYTMHLKCLVYGKSLLLLATFMVVISIGGKIVKTVQKEHRVACSMQREQEGTRAL